MTLTRLYDTGFEFQSITEVDFYLPYGTSVPVITTTAGQMRTGLAALAFTSGSYPSGKIISPSTTQISANAYIRQNSYSGTTAGHFAIVALITGATEIIIGVRVSTGNLEIVVGGVTQVTVALTTAFPVINTFYAIGVTAKADATTGFVSVYRDGVQIMTWTGNTGTTITGVYYGGRTINTIGWSGSFIVDDITIDDAVAEPDVAPSSPRWAFLLVNAAGALANWTPSAGSNFQNVDDAGANDGDATFNYVTASGVKDALAIANTVAGTTVPAGFVIKSVVAGAIVRKSDAGFDSQIKLGIRDGSANESLGSAQTLPTTYGYKRQRFTTTPLGAAWSEAAVDGTQIVLESAGTFS
jgi:hypothetical protein